MAELWSLPGSKASTVDLCFKKDQSGIKVAETSSLMKSHTQTEVCAAKELHGALVIASVANVVVVVVTKISSTDVISKVPPIAAPT